MRSRFELVIFDCDGVLVDSEPIINQAHAHVLTVCGYPITEQDLVERFCGMSDAEMLGVIEREWGRALPASYAERVGLPGQDSAAGDDRLAVDLDALACGDGNDQGRRACRCSGDPSGARLARTGCKYARSRP